MSPFCHCCRGVLLLSILFNCVLYISSTVWFASIIASFGMLSGPVLFPHFSCLVACLIALVVIGLESGSLSISLFLLQFVVCVPYIVHTLAFQVVLYRYRSLKYSLVCILASSGFSSFVPSSVIVSYSSCWPLLSSLLLCFQNSLRFILLALLSLLIVCMDFPSRLPLCIL